MPTRQVFLLLGASWEVKRAEEIGGKFVDHFAPPNERLVSSFLVSSRLVLSGPSGVPSLDHSWCESGPSHSLSLPLTRRLEVQTRSCDITPLLLLQIVSCHTSLASGVFRDFP